MSCKQEPRLLQPLVDFNKCEGKGPCIPICPYDVFEMLPISKENYSKLNFIGKIKTFVHGKNKAFVAKPEMCHSCGLCVTACPESAIKLITFINT
jgi:4Fe-4S ferredoxin